MNHASDAATILGALAVSSLALNTLFLANARVLAPFAGVAITEACLGFGPRLFSLPFAEGRLEVKLVPLSAYVQFAGANPYEDDPVAPAPPRVLWTEASLARRALAFYAAPRLLMGAFAAALLGPRRAASAILSGATDALAAFYGAAPLFDRAAAVLAEEGFLGLAALTLAKCVSVHALYLPFDLLTLMDRRHMKTVARLRGIILLLWIVLLLAWLVAFLRWTF